LALEKKTVGFEKEVKGMGKNKGALKAVPLFWHVNLN